MASPGIIAGADQRIESRDFQILKISTWCYYRTIRSRLTPSKRPRGESLDRVRNSIRESGNDSPIAGTETMLTDIEKIETLPRRYDTLDPMRS